MADIARDTGFVEIADRCWVARSSSLDVNVGLVGGERGLLLVDTHGSQSEAHRVVAQLRALGAGDVVAVANTHGHAPHSSGNAVVAGSYGAPPVYAHEDAAAGAVPAYGEDCFPMEWPATLDLLIGLLTPGTVVVPGHGGPVGKEFVEEQRG